MYTVEIYRIDGRMKKTAQNPRGERLVLKEDYDTTNLSMLEHTVKTSLQKGERYEIHETYVTRRNAMTGLDFQERYDTPFTSSPASESYWCM